MAKLRKPSITVIMIDDRSSIHTAVEQALALEEDIRLVAHGSTGNEALDLCDTYLPHVILMDVVMPGMNGIEATRSVLARYPRIKILALSSFEDQDAVIGMLEAGAVGYVLKTADALTGTLSDTIRDVFHGKSVLSPAILKLLVLPNSDSYSMTINSYHLTRRELEVLHHMANGKSNSEIAAALMVSLSTVKHHVSSVLAKMGVTTRTEAVSLAIKQKLVN